MNIDTDKSLISSDSGVDYVYALERKRQWNIGLRKHIMALTGNVVLYFPRGEDKRHSYSICPSFTDAKEKIAEHETKVAATLQAASQDTSDEAQAPGLTR